MITVKADDRRRVMLPGTKPKQEFRFLEREDGTIMLTPLTKEKAMPKVAARPTGKTSPPPKVRFIKRGRYTVGHTDKHVSLETIKELLAEFP